MTKFGSSSDAFMARLARGLYTAKFRQDGRAGPIQHGNVRLQLGADYLVTLQILGGHLVANLSHMLFITESVSVPFMHILNRPRPVSLSFRFP